MPGRMRKQDPTYGDWSGIRRSMSYGQLPTRAEFKKAFNEEIDGRYRIRDRRLGDSEHRLTEAQLWKLLAELRNVHRFGRNEDVSEEAGSLASDILGTLGFEWI